MTINTRTTSLTVPSISELRALFNGRVIAPDDPRYEQARTVFYVGVDRHPAAIVRVADAGDVSRMRSATYESRDNGALSAPQERRYLRPGTGFSLAMVYYRPLTGHLDHNSVAGIEMAESRITVS